MWKCHRAATHQARRKPDAGNTWETLSERWGRLMTEARAGDDMSYEILLRELDIWLRRYYARRLPYPAADDARQDALLAVHISRFRGAPLAPFGAWLLGIARHKWVDRIRDATRHSAQPLSDKIPIEDHGSAVIGGATLNDLLGRLRPAQESVIRLVKLEGLSISLASDATGQSAALVKVNIHRGLKKLSALVSQY
jgi:RNA polymerase sigma factor (sigma-70 family)